jgi:hypothetical protein
MMNLVFLDKNQSEHHQTNAVLTIVHGRAMMFHQAISVNETKLLEVVHSISLDWEDKHLKETEGTKRMGQLTSLMKM